MHVASVILDDSDHYGAILRTIFKRNCKLYSPHNIIPPQTMIDRLNIFPRLLFWNPRWQAALSIQQNLRLSMRHGVCYSKASNRLSQCFYPPAVDEHCRRDMSGFSGDFDRVSGGNKPLQTGKCLSEENAGWNHTRQSREAKYVVSIVC